ncbi:MAG: zinc ABC transporter substrate-binding protein [Alphaproteobacteria bacterium]|nr:MAG: zinc ABC transporter substrate-binding protein [Alphaproteobacteria bacterium]
MGMRTASPIRTIGSTRPMPRRSAAPSPKPAFAWRRKWRKNSSRAARLIAYHNTWPYFARRFRLDVVDVIEIKEGVAPSPARLARLAAIMREQKIRLIVHEPFEPEEASQLLARRTGAAVVKLAPSVGSLPAANSYLALFDYNVATLAQALSAVSN